MTRDQIYEALGVIGASEAVKQQIIENIVTTVELRFAGIIDDLLDDEQLGRFESIVGQHGDDLDAITGWLQTNVPKAAELYLAVLNDHVDELRDQLNERVSGDL
jgi:hypothetical protein